MSPRRSDAPVVLAHHGLPADADAPTLLAALTARGWQAHVEELAADDLRRPARFRVLALRRRPGVPRPGYGSHEHLQATGVTAEAALAMVLAAVLEREV